MLANQKPKVSILLPNLNTSKYLPARFESIQAQTFTNWETIVVDSYSSDGSWELIQQYAQHDPRIIISQAPREGFYAGLNRCINLAKGEYIYIATSDDTMMPNCLEEMVAALDTYPQCDLAHCCLTIIDEHGMPIQPNPWDRYYPSLYYGEKMQKFHIRQAPLDGILHCFLYTVYTSLTQLLIRKSLFSKIGTFSTCYGSMADFAWGMKASLVSDTIHIPNYLATWRRYPEQATSNTMLDNPQTFLFFISMMREAISCGLDIRPEFRKYFSDMKKLTYIYDYLYISSDVGKTVPRLGRLGRFFRKLKHIPQRGNVVFDKYVFRKEELDHLEYAKKLISDLELDAKVTEARPYKQFMQE